MSDLRITRHNLYDIPLGQPLTVFRGCPPSTGGWDDETDLRPQQETGIVVDHVFDDHPLFPLAYLVVEFEDGVAEQVSQLSSRGIGWRLGEEA